MPAFARCACWRCCPCRPSHRPPTRRSRRTCFSLSVCWTGEGASHAGWVVLVRDGAIVAVGDASTVDAPADARRIALPGATLVPGLIDLHSHVFLHPYNETLWNDQVLKELERRARPARGAPRARHAAGRVHDAARPRHRRRELRRRRRSSTRSTSGIDRRPAPVRRDQGDRRDRELRPRPARLPRRSSALPRGAQEVSGVDAGIARGARPGRPRRRLDQAVRRLSASAPTAARNRRSRSAELKAMVEAAHRLGPPGRRARDDRQGRAHGDRCGRRHHRTRLRRLRGDLPPDARTRRRVAADADGAPRRYGEYFEHYVPGAVAAHAGHARCRRAPSPARARPARRSAAAAMSACSATATTSASRNGWCAWA